MSIASIQGLTLATLDRTDFGIEQTKSTGGGPSAVVNAGSLVGFEGGISEDEQEDILYSLQFAQRAASGAADRFTQIKGWYTKYVEVLTDVGWTLKNFDLNEQKVDQSEVEVAKAALEILAAAATGPQSVVLLAAIKALKGMAKEDGFITLFEHYGAQGLIGNFQVSDVARGPNHELNITTGAFQIKMEERQDGFLFVKWHKKGVSVWGSATTASFNRQTYAEVRDTVKQMLGAYARKAIAEVPLKLD